MVSNWLFTANRSLRMRPLICSYNSKTLFKIVSFDFFNELIKYWSIPLLWALLAKILIYSSFQSSMCLTWCWGPLWSYSAHIGQIRHLWRHSGLRHTIISLLNSWSDEQTKVSCERTGIYVLFKCYISH